MESRYPSLPTFYAPALPRHHFNGLHQSLIERPLTDPEHRRPKIGNSSGLVFLSHQSLPFPEMAFLEEAWVSDMSLVPLGRRAPVTSTPVRRSGESIEPRELDAHRTTNPHDITSNSQICYISSHRPSPCSLYTRPAATHAPHRVFPLQDMITRFSAGFTHPCPSPPSRPFFVKIVVPSPRPLSVDCFHRPPRCYAPTALPQTCFFLFDSADGSRRGWDGEDGYTVPAKDGRVP